MRIRERLERLGLELPEPFVYPSKNRTGSVVTRGADTWATSYTLSRAVRALGDVRLIVCGKQAVDGDNNQVAQLVAGHLGLPQACFAADVELAAIESALDGKLARFKQPKAVVNVSSLPRNTMGKVQKNLLREQFAGLLTED